MNTQQSYLLRSTILISHPLHIFNPQSNPISLSKFPINPTFSLLKPGPLLQPARTRSSLYKTSSTQEQKWVHEGVITESLPNGMFWVRCDNGDVILGYVSGKMRRGSIRILPGDKVKIEVSRYDSTRGRIIYRTRS